MENESFQLVVFRLHEDEFAVPIEQVHEIIRPQAVTRMPRAPYYVDGILNLRGRVFPVVDFNKRLKMPESAVGPKSRIMVVEVSGDLFGLNVDEVKEVLRAGKEEFEKSPMLVKDSTSEYMTGVIKHGERMILMLDLDRLFTVEEVKEIMGQSLEAAE